VCGEAINDEIRHAQLAFALAERFDSKASGPGRLERSGLLESSNCEHHIFAGLLEEACVGETLSALEAADFATLAESPVVAETLKTVAIDEERHAAYVWKCLRWYLGTIRDGKARDGARSATETMETLLAGLREEAQVQVEDVTASENDAELLALGKPSRALRARISREGILTIVVPAPTAVLAEFRDAVAGPVTRLEGGRVLVCEV
jgi:hypothetical protein